MRRTITAGLAFAVVGAGLWMWWREVHVPPRKPTARTAKPEPRRTPQPVPTGPPSSVAPGSEDALSTVVDPVTPPPFDLAKLDFRALRSRTPDSLYWLMAAPTDDPDALEARRIARQERDLQYRKVVSNTATAEEIQDYYAFRQKLSEDYVEISQLILDAHGDALSERDVGLLELAISMHAAALLEIPVRLDAALQRKLGHNSAPGAERGGPEEKTR